MQIVIDIPEEYYEKVIKTIPDWQASADTLMIKNGTPLPKGHGRLIDGDELLKRLDRAVEYWHDPEEKDSMSRKFGDGLKAAADKITDEWTVVPAEEVVQ